ncbi:MAG: anti-sigma regulatory factor [Vicinamibacterales bacterium]
MSTKRSETFELRRSEDLVRLRHAVREWMAELGFSLVDQTKMMTAASELGRNALDYAGTGVVHGEVVGDGLRTGLRLVFEDHGPGIANIPQAMTDGFSTSGGLGLGLSGSRRLVNEFDIRSTPGEGTRITITRWK